MKDEEGNTLKSYDNHEGFMALPRNSVECDFIELNGSLCAQAIEIIEYRNLDYSHELYGYPYLCPACDHAKVTALQRHYRLERADD